ncbi:MAG TPA: hypothetical protein VK843_13090, partial [Planctomycetota bacterium]|nr:hypothetical protein [Planctomycetota bacterium]
TYLESPAINLLNCPHPILRFQRWLTVESALHDQARVKVNGQVIWTNSNAADHADLGWTEFEFDLSAIASGTPNTKIRFELVTDGVVQKGGWNIDDVQIFTASAVGLSCVDPIPYCTSKLTSLGTTPSLNSLGSNSATLQSLRIELIEASLSKPGILLRSSAGQASVPFSGGTLCIQQPIVRYATFTTDSSGSALVPITIQPGMIGQTWYFQAWFRDPPASFGVGLTNGVQIKFCP